MLGVFYCLCIMLNSPSIVLLIATFVKFVVEVKIDHRSKFSNLY